MTKTATIDGTVVSRDGTPISFEQTGSGRPVILVASALADRRDTKRLARLLSAKHTVINYDRRGRGESGDTPPYDVQREIDDLAALIKYAGGSASLFGSSSGAVLVLRAAARGLPVDRVVVYEPPFVVGEGKFGPPPGFASRIDELLAADRRGDAVKAFMTEAQGMPQVMVSLMRLVPGMWRTLTSIAHTLPYDIAVMGDTQQGRPLSTQPWCDATAPTLVLTGSKSPAAFHDAADELVTAMPDAVHDRLQGLNHSSVVAAPKKVAPAISAFLQR